MKKFDIHRPDQEIREALVDKINNLTKPKGSLGRLEEIALQVGLIQQSLTPRLCHPQNVIFAADHGIVEENVSVSPKEVTWQQCLHFPKGGAGISFLCRQHGFTLKVVDAGVDYDFEGNSDIIDMKVRRGTRNYLHEPAMTPDEWDECIKRGGEVVDMCHKEGTNIISFGEMGIGNTSSSSIWMALLGNIPVEECIGAGSGLDSPGIKHKMEILRKAVDNYGGDGSVESILRWFGGLEMAMAVGGMLRAAELGMVILVDGFIMTACMLAAHTLYPEVKEYAIFGHCGDESAHAHMLSLLDARPLLNLDLRLGEGSGAVCAYPIVQSGVNMINEMDSFRSASITKYFN